MIYRGIFNKRHFSVNFSNLEFLKKEKITDKLCGVYFILNKNRIKSNGAFLYIGSAFQLRDRVIRNHVKKLNQNQHTNKHLQNSWNLYGQGQFLFGLLEQCYKNNCRKREQNWLDFFNYNFKQKVLFNLCDKVESGPINRGKDHPNFGKHLSIKTIKKISKLAKQRMSDPRNNPMYGKKHSLETKLKIAKARIGKKLKFPVWNKGKKMSSTTKEKISQTLKEKWKKNLIKINHYFKTYYLISPENAPIIVHNLSEFCRTNRLSRSCLNRVISRKRNHYKGWRLDQEKNAVSGV